MKKFAILGVAVTVAICIIGIILSTINQKYMLSAVCILLPLIAIYTYKSKLFKPTEDVKINKYIRNCTILSFIFLFLIGITNILLSLQTTVKIGLVAACVVSVAYTFVYGVNHEQLYKLNKGYFIPFFMTSALLCALVFSGVYCVPKEFLEIPIGDGGVTLYMLAPLIVGGKFIADILLGLDIFPDIAW